jgi:C4-dicarboxylate transporter
MSFPADGGDSAMNPLSPSAAALTESGFTGSECSTPTSDSMMVANLSSVSIGEFASKAQVKGRTCTAVSLQVAWRIVPV